MDALIQNLSITGHSKYILDTLGFTKVSRLLGHNYLTLIKLTANQRDILYVVHDLNRLGLLLAPEQEIPINSLPISNRLKHILERNYILYLSQLSEIPKEKIQQFRSLGKLSMQELEHICAVNNIPLH